MDVYEQNAVVVVGLGETVLLGNLGVGVLIAEIGVMRKLA